MAWRRTNDGIFYWRSMRHTMSEYTAFLHMYGRKSNIKHFVHVLWYWSPITARGFSNKITVSKKHAFFLIWKTHDDSWALPSSAINRYFMIFGNDWRCTLCDIWANDDLPGLKYNLNILVIFAKYQWKVVLMLVNLGCNLEADDRLHDNSTINAKKRRLLMLISCRIISC